MQTIKIGSRGEDVKVLQRALHLIDDGIFGKLTQEAVIAFQKKNNLTPDGIVGAKTWALIMPTLLSSSPRSKRKITEIIVHCTATKEGKDFHVDDIRKWHKEKGWSDIGYHYVVYLDGSIHDGRNIDLIGAHCEGHNSHSIGVVYVGGLDRNGANKDTRTPQQKIALLSLIKSLKRTYPQAIVYGHCDLDKHGKTCPNFNAKQEYAFV